MMLAGRSNVERRISLRGRTHLVSMIRDYNGSSKSGL